MQCKQTVKSDNRQQLIVGISNIGASPDRRTDGTLRGESAMCRSKWNAVHKSACPSANFHINRSRWNRIQHPSSWSRRVLAISPPIYVSSSHLALSIVTDI